jgi:hypothetical protein
MITAIKTVHWKKGIWVSADGYDYNLVLLAAVFGLTENGPGDWSVDALLGRWCSLRPSTGRMRRRNRRLRTASPFLPLHSGWDQA